MKKLSLNAGLIVLLLVLFTGCSTVMLTGRKQFNVVTDAEMLTIADSSYKAYMATATVSKKTIQNALVSRVGSKITTAVQNYLSAQGQSSLIEGYNWDFKLVVDTAVKAFCMGGGAAGKRSIGGLLGEKRPDRLAHQPGVSGNRRHEKEIELHFDRAPGRNRHHRHPWRQGAAAG